jgi:hypothetical protein
MCIRENVAQFSKRREEKPNKSFLRKFYKNALNFKEKQISKIKELRVIFWSEDPDVNNRAEFPNRRIVIHLVYIYLCSSVGVGNRLRDGRQGKACSILDKATKPLLSSKGPDRVLESLNLIIKGNREFSHRWWNRRRERLTANFKLANELKVHGCTSPPSPHTVMMLFLIKHNNTSDC